MGYFDKYNVSGSGMSVQKMRMNIISSNIANANTTMTEDGTGPYKRKDVIFKSQSFDTYLGLEKKDKNKMDFDIDISNDIDDLNKKTNVGVEVDKIFVDEKDFIKKYEPHHPHANKEGYVLYPNVNPIVEMANMIEATRAYETNANAYNNQKQIDMQTIDLLK